MGAAGLAGRRPGVLASSRARERTHGRAETTQRAGRRADGLDGRESGRAHRCPTSVSVRISMTAAPATLGSDPAGDSASTRGGARHYAAAARGPARARARAHPPPRLSRQRAADAGGDAVLLSSGDLVGVATHSSRARTLLRRHRHPRVRRRTWLCTGAHVRCTIADRAIGNCAGLGRGTASDEDSAAAWCSPPSAGRSPLWVAFASLH